MKILVNRDTSKYTCSDLHGGDTFYLKGDSTLYMKLTLTGHERSALDLDTGGYVAYVDLDCGGLNVAAPSTPVHLVACVVKEDEDVDRI